MLRFIVAAVIALAGLQSASAECANACNGHGKCTSYDMCICNRNWQAADCSERVCQFGLAHVDTPKGDLNGDGSVSNANEVVVDNSYVYPYGTTEQFPQMQNTDLQTLSDTAHYYMECSNKGKCDRTTGECQCFDGYDGVACQRASCPGYPNSCSGHGVCKTIKQLARADYSNVYELWDKDSTMGCQCDAGYMGPDCSQRVCKTGVDPLYLDDAATVHYSTWNIGLFTTDTSNQAKNNFTYNIFDSTHPGYWAIKFYDSFGEDWVTDPIVAGASCSQVTEALESLPNNVIKTSTIECTRIALDNANELTNTTSRPWYDAQHPSSSSHPYRLYYKMAMWDAQTSALYGELSAATDTSRYFSSYNNATDKIALSGYIYLLKMYGNPGNLAEPKIDVYLDGHLPTLISQSNKVITKVWTDGQQGEDNDYFADHCAGVTVTIGTARQVGQVPLTVSYLTGFTSTEKALLKTCLGSADFNTSNNQDVYNWDYGSKLYPHIVKLVRTVTTMTDGGYYAVLYYDTTNAYPDNTGDGTSFVLLNPFVPPDAFSTDNYDVYTTQGTLALTSELSQASFSFGSRYIYTLNGTYDMNRTNDAQTSLYSSSFSYPYDGDISCEVGNHNAGKLSYIYHCLNKSDIFTLLNWEYPELNPPHINLYTAERVIQKAYTHATKDKYATAVGNNTELHEGSHMITTDLSTNWGVSFPSYYAASTSNTNFVYKTITPAFHVYKFFPAEASTYNYVNECANRGLCDRDAGVCKCFPGYTSDNCAEQSSLAV